MTRLKQTSLRARLRSVTRVSHNQLDEVVSRFDLTTTDGFLSFMRMQVTALRMLVPHLMSTMSREMVIDLLERAESDLGQFGPLGQNSLPTISALHPISIDYVVAGSRLGAQVLKKRWLSAKIPTVQRANAYFSAPSYIETWTSFCTTAEAMSPTGPLADQIVGDTDLIFQLYFECARAPQFKEGAIHA